MMSTVPTAETKNVSSSSGSAERDGTRRPRNRSGEVSREDAGIGGGIGPTNQPGAKNQVTFYIDVDDIDAYLEKINKAGGKTVMPATPVSPDTTFAQFTDPAGNLIGLFKHSGP
jgi:predicted enzyme related to lactoylglutathione lyase